jgi:hypothetical protein
MAQGQYPLTASRFLTGLSARFGMTKAFEGAAREAEDRFAGNNPAGCGIWGKIEGMPYILEHLSSLRQEITDLRNMNARFTGKGSDTQIDQSAVEMRANRLAEIKKELSQMLNRPEDPAVWWEKGGRGKRVA